MTLHQRSCANGDHANALRQRSCAIWVVDSIDLHKIMMRGGRGDQSGRTLDLVPIGPVDQCMPTTKKRKKKKINKLKKNKKMSASVRVRRIHKAHITYCSRVTTSALER